MLLDSNSRHPWILSMLVGADKSGIPRTPEAHWFSILAWETNITQKHPIGNDKRTIPAMTRVQEEVWKCGWRFVGVRGLRNGLGGRGKSYSERGLSPAICLNPFPQGSPIFSAELELRARGFSVGCCLFRLSDKEWVFWGGGKLLGPMFSRHGTHGRVNKP